MGKISLVVNAPAKGKWQFSTFLNFEKSKTKSDLFMLFSKIGRQVDYFGKIKRNSKFRPCRRILKIYRDRLLIMVFAFPHFLIAWLPYFSLRMEEAVMYGLYAHSEVRKRLGANCITL